MQRRDPLRVASSRERIVQEIRDFLERAGLVPPGEIPQFEPLAGGVSSDIWLVRAGSSGVLREARARPPARGGGVARGCLAKRSRRCSG